MSGEEIDYTEAHTEEIPVYDPAAEVSAGDLQDAALFEGEGWLEDGVRQHVEVICSGVAMMFADGHPSAYKATQEDLDRIAPPLARILNRYESLRQLGVISDPILLIEGGVLYAGRSMLQVKAMRQERAEREAALEGHPAPPVGRPAPPAAAAARNGHGPAEPEPPVEPVGETRAERISREWEQMRAEGLSAENEEAEQ